MQLLFFKGKQISRTVSNFLSMSSFFFFFSSVSEGMYTDGQILFVLGHSIRGKIRAIEEFELDAYVNINLE